MAHQDDDTGQTFSVLLMNDDSRNTKWYLMYPFSIAQASRPISFWDFHIPEGPVASYEPNHEPCTFLQRI